MDKNNRRSLNIQFNSAKNARKNNVPSSIPLQFGKERLGNDGNGRPTKHTNKTGIFSSNNDLTNE